MQTLLYLHNKMIQCCILITESVRAITDVVDDCVVVGDRNDGDDVDRLV